jgi:hypothetical protein
VAEVNLQIGKERIVGYFIEIFEKKMFGWEQFKTAEKGSPPL